MEKPFFILSSLFFILHSSLLILHFSFSILPSSFFIHKDFCGWAGGQNSLVKWNLMSLKSCWAMLST